MVASCAPPVGILTHNQACALTGNRPGNPATNLQACTQSTEPHQQNPVCSLQDEKQKHPSSFKIAISRITSSRNTMCFTIKSTSGISHLIIQPTMWTHFTWGHLFSLSGFPYFWGRVYLKLLSLCFLKRLDQCRFSYVNNYLSILRKGKRFNIYF